ncbi:antibiotic biosynthesis monooxygenase family protein [Aliiroseovarius sediminis]|uniref:antibiotic biosynthesis monooxygenase family protein n=1 Tax=Aliiroseovarius sediminis TaxID=2925839 RepID=UPI001F5975B2|nr:antibiotic biosynthesis monooxygenase family protein [Aliiroseovarius sediminis]MCI2394853.1 antibiotic biosynthesis monooxygenase [Aliiroseovarius sediminis]
MVKITENQTCQTVMLTYEVPLGAYDELHGILTAAYEDFLSKQKGFIGAAIHSNEAQTRVASYSQWASRDDFLAVLRSEHMQKVNRQLGDISKAFEPVLYDVQTVFGD